MVWCRYLFSNELIPLLFNDERKFVFNSIIWKTLHWRHNWRDGVSNHQPHDCLLNRLFGRRSKKTSKLYVTGLYAGNSPVTGEFPVQKDSNVENDSIWWRHHVQQNPHVMCFTERKTKYDVCTDAVESNVLIDQDPSNQYGLIQIPAWISH